MTQQLLQISSVFLVQQSELQQVRDRLKKELLRVNSISEALTSAAQQHQDAVRGPAPPTLPTAHTSERQLHPGRRIREIIMGRLVSREIASSMVTDARQSTQRGAHRDTVVFTSTRGRCTWRGLRIYCMTDAQRRNTDGRVQTTSKPRCVCGGGEFGRFTSCQSGVPPRFVTVPKRARYTSGCSSWPMEGPRPAPRRWGAGARM